MMRLKFQDRHWINFIPDDDVPGYGVMVAYDSQTEDNGSILLKTQQLQTDGERPIFINGPGNCGSKSSGICFRPDATICVVAYDTNDGTPAVGEIWGPQPGTYLIKKGTSGFKILDAGSDGLVLAEYVPLDLSVFYQLAANLDAQGTATAHPVNWDTSGDGSYSVDTGTTVTVKDVLSQCWGLTYEWIECQVMGAANGPVYAVKRGGAQWHTATLGATLSQGGSASATVTIRGNSVSLTVYDKYLKSADSLASSTVVGIEYEAEDKKWYVTQASCS
jgi:hypothetical protein